MKSLLAVLFSSAAACLRAGSPDACGFVTDWLVSGPWPSYQVKDVGQGLRTDFLQPEDEVLPYAGKSEKATFTADWGVLVAGVGSSNEWGFRTNTTFDASWRVMSARDGIVRLNGTFAPIDDYFVAYAACYIESPRVQPARIAVGSDDDHKLFLDLTEVGKAVSSQDILPGSFKYDVTLPKGRSRLLLKVQDRTGGCGFCVQLLDRANHPLTNVTVTTEARGLATTLAATLAERRSPAKLRARFAAARQTLAASGAALAAARAETDALTNRLANVKAALHRAYAVREAQYATQHAAAARAGRKSVDEPFAPESRRTALCLNGFWESSIGTHAKWGRTYLPSKLLNDYFWSWYYPVSKGKPLAGFEDVFDKANNAANVCYRTTVDWNGEGEGVLRCEAILGHAASFRLNGREVGTCSGDRGVVRVSLEGLRTGGNTLEIETGYGRASGGVRGDIWFETHPKVFVDEVWVKTSWRTSTLSAQCVVKNDTETPHAVEVESYAVKDGRVKFRLPKKRIELAAYGASTLVLKDVWADPETWGIGGKYGEPTLYTLVTDVREDGRLVDREEETFGFREFWIDHTDFFLNGRRILLQGDVGHLTVCDKRRRDVVWPLYRADGINLVRLHDSDSQWSITAMRDADRMGMAVCAQMYPKLSEKGVPHTERDFSPFATWKETAAHRENLAAYTRWWKDMRNHPSVLLWSTDNEILTQAWDTEAKAPYNVRNDRIGALYEKYMKTLDPDLVMTRDGDVGTWNHAARWFEDPPCDTANYHYPNYDNANWAVGWQQTYEYRPVVFGEALYCAYFQNGWIGALPKLVKSKAEQVASCVKLYTELEIPCAIYMGLGLDGFTVLDDTGKGNPWGLRASDLRRYGKEHVLPPGRKVDQYPWLRIPWPAYSGEGERLPADRVGCTSWGTASVNVYEEGVPSHVRNDVNEAYRAALRPQPPIDAGRYAEAIVTASPGAAVWTATPAGNLTGVRADDKGRAWFRSLAPGSRSFVSGATSRTVTLPARSPHVAKPGFVAIPQVAL